MPAHVYLDDVEVLPLLTRMRLPKPALLDILSKTAGERANVSPTDPQTAAGYESWRWGTRFCREDLDLARLGWVSCTYNQIDGIRHDDLRIKLVVCNMNGNTGNPEKDPKNIGDRGPASCKLIKRNSAQTVMDFMKSGDAVAIDDYDFWYYGIHICDAHIAGEISRPDLVEGSIIRSFSDRIIIAKPGDLDGLRPRGSVPEDFAKVDKPEIRRKK